MGKTSSPKEAFEEIDVSEKDGKITIEEFVEYATKKLGMSKEEAEEIFKKYLDKDGDGEVTEEEIFIRLGGCKKCGDKYDPGEDELDVEEGEGEGKGKGKG